jgi:hypothetical protein
MPQTDIRDKPTLTHDDITALNFVKSSVPYVFRRHFRQGLRSHIMEILESSDVRIERTGVFRDGVKWFPKATPRKMFRIFRTRLKTLDNAMNEIARVKIVERFLAPDFMATSTECIVDYQGPGGRDLMLCGFQEYVAGEIFDPWSVLDATGLLSVLFDTFRNRGGTMTLSKDEWMGSVRLKGSRFIDHIKRMIAEAGHIPDLAGAGNLIITCEGDIRLVDINNISRVVFDPTIPLDEQGYPVCDKSIEALALIEEKILGRPVDKGEYLYRRFLNTGRRRTVREKEALFRKGKDAG